MMPVKNIASWVLGLNMVNLGVVFMLFYQSGINPVFLIISLLTTSGLIFLQTAQSAPFRLPHLLPLLILLGFYTLAFVVHFKAARISSYFYTLFYLFSFLVVSGYCKDLLTKEKLGMIIRMVLYLQLGMMMLQQACFLFNLPIPNLNPDFTAEFLDKLSFFRMNALSNEPSYGALIVVILSFLYHCLYGLKTKDLLPFWIPAVYLFVFFQSGLATILAPLLILIILLGKRWWLMPLILLAAFPLVQNLESENRVILLLQQLDIRAFADTFMEADLSGAFRVVPSIFYLEQADVLSINFWIGHGIDYGNEYASRLMPGVETFQTFLGGAFPFMLFDYGLLTFAAFLYFIHKTASVGNRIAFWLLAFFLMTNANLSTQLMWLFITLAAATKLMVHLPSETGEPPAKETAR